MVKTMVKTQFVFYFSDWYHPGCQFLQACTQCKAFLNSGNLLMIDPVLHCPVGHIPPAAGSVVRKFTKRLY